MMNFFEARVDVLEDEKQALQEKLSIAVKALEEYADKDNWFDCLSWDGYLEDSEVVVLGQYGENGYEFAKEALAKIKEIK